MLCPPLVPEALEPVGVSRVCRSHPVAPSGGLGDVPWCIGRKRAKPTGIDGERSYRPGRWPRRRRRAPRIPACCIRGQGTIRGHNRSSPPGAGGLRMSHPQAGIGRRVVDALRSYGGGGFPSSGLSHRPGSRRNSGPSSQVAWRTSAGRVGGSCPRSRRLLSMPMTRMIAARGPG